jgi:hypothetical protein
MKNLERLDLVGTYVTDKGIQIFQSARDFGKLNLLMLSKTRVTQKGVDKLEKARGNRFINIMLL